MNSKLLTIAAVSISVSIVAILAIFLIESHPLNNESKNYFSGEYKIKEDDVTVINNQSFYVSKLCNTNCSNGMKFHSVTFIIPPVSLTTPGGFNAVMVGFPDGTNETLTFASRGITLSTFTKHMHPQAGATLNANGTLNFLVSK